MFPLGETIRKPPRVRLMILLPMIAIDYGVGGLLKASTTTDHLLVLYWKDTAGVTTATLQGGEKEIREICAELDKFSKRSAVDLDTATQQTRAEFQEQSAIHELLH